MHQEITVIGEIEVGPQFAYTWAGPHCLFLVDLEDVWFNVTTRGLLAETCWRELHPELEVCVIGTLHYLDILGHPMLELRAQQVWNRDEQAIPYLLEGSQVDEPY